MSTHVEWIEAGHFSLGLTLVEQGQRWDGEPTDGDGDDDHLDVSDELGTVFGSDDVVILTGTATDVRNALGDALALLDERDDTAAQALGDEPCPGHRDGHHRWTLTETGYERTWRTTVHLGGRVTAVYNGTSDWSETGAGDDHLRCDLCPAPPRGRPRPHQLALTQHLVPHPRRSVGGARDDPAHDFRGHHDHHQHNPPPAERDLATPQHVRPSRLR
ncbi:hypothetical protein [Cellulosimicrobium sp. KWT-B]|uniref:hypothetical protein n=1 Tax=Cellulosimicrobium sp. KWT-B TaxID=1981152 RepID=UPI000A32AAEB|nr:hypothetical protein [Cellulosimicrobium sp. KWT-B]